MPDFSDYCIMVVEDSLVQRLHALEVLASLGVLHTLEAADGQQALEVLAAAPRKPDILITDLEMPGMDGVDLIAGIARRQLASALIVVSGLESNLLRTVETMAREYGLRVLGVARKPLSAEHLSLLISRYSLASPSIDASPANPSRFSHDDLLTAVDQQQLLLHYQPKVTMASGLLRGVEALVRWQHPQLGLIAPTHFIPDTEQSGVIDRLTDWVLGSALTQLAHWHAHGLKISVAVNLSPHSLAHPDLADRIAARVQASGLEPRWLILEITETAVMSNLALSLGTLARLRLKGFGLAIDDFGTGVSSMQQLSRIPFTELKIDRSLVDGAAESPQLQGLLQGIVEMSKRLNLVAVAEGVENPADWQFIRQLGCELSQGFFVAKPMPGETLPGWLKQDNRHFRPQRPGVETP